MNSGIVKEFKDFIMQGDVVSLAIAVVIGVAFGAVVTAFTDGIILPFIAAIGGKPNFDSVAFNVGDGRIAIGSFITALLTFVIIAAVVFFFVVKPMNVLRERSAKHEVAPPPAPPEDVALLREIRDLLSRR